MRIILRSFLAILMGAFLLSPAYAQTSTAPDIAPQPCDTQYWKQMSARAWMEAEREIMQNQNLIFKADSVLEYTCFDQFVNVAAYKGGDIFTHTTYFGQEIIGRGTNESMDSALTETVYQSLAQYIGANFSHRYLGERAQNLAAGNKDSQFQPPSGPLSGGYACNEMANVWKAAKCANFVDNQAFEDTDGFYPFEGIMGHNGTPDVAGYDTLVDTRNFPSSCRATSGPAGITGYSNTLGPAGTWTDQIALADNDTLYPFQAPLSQIYTDVGERLVPVTSASNCSTPILTGVQVVTGSGTAYPDGICTNPGCIYNKTGTCILPPVTGSGPLVGGGGPAGVITP